VTFLGRVASALTLVDSRRVTCFYRFSLLCGRLNCNREMLYNAQLYRILNLINFLTDDYCNKEVVNFYTHT